ncbi:FMN-binding protein [Elusimicrobiota bacterium]
MKKLIVLLIVTAVSYATVVIHDYLGIYGKKERKLQSHVIHEGSFIGESDGFVDKIIVKVTFSVRSEHGSVKIDNIEIISSKEIKLYWDRVRNTILREVLGQQSTKVDTVTGATESSRGLLEAIEDAKKKAAFRDK